MAEAMPSQWKRAQAIPRWDLSVIPFLFSRDLVPSFSLLLISPPIFPLFWLVLLSM